MKIYKVIKGDIVKLYYGKDVFYYDVISVNTEENEVTIRVDHIERTIDIEDISEVWRKVL